MALDPVVAYLAHYGYLPKLPSGAVRTTGKTIGKALESFQAFAGLPVTGQVDAATLALMARPRCGVPDISNQDLATDGTIWSKPLLHWACLSHPDQITMDQFRAVSAQSFKAWSDLILLDIAEADSSGTAIVDLRIDTGRGAGSGFDGPGGILAWAFMPNSDNPLTCKLDLDENWGLTGGIIVANVTGHEFGHLLGLSHSSDPGALMYPYYNPSISIPQSDDITRITALYGPRNPLPVPHSIAVAGAVVSIVVDGVQKWSRP